MGFLPDWMSGETNKKASEPEMVNAANSFPEADNETLVGDGQGTTWFNSTAVDGAGNVVSVDSLSDTQQDANVIHGTIGLVRGYTQHSEAEPLGSRDDYLYGPYVES